MSKCGATLLPVNCFTTGFRGSNHRCNKKKKLCVSGTVLSKSLGSAFRRISWLFGAFRGFLTKFRLKRKFGDISANFRDAYCPNPRELSNDISLCSKYRGENSAKIRRKCARLENSLRIFERTFVRFSKRF